jgi:hypothetical protein
VIQNLFDYHGVFNAGDDINAAAALITDFDIHFKGWLDQAGQKRVTITDVATSSEAEQASDELCAVYTDPEYAPSLSAYYYLRLVETP